MSIIPKIALFETNEEDFSSLKALFSRHEYSLRVANSLLEIEHFIEDEGEPFDAIVLSLRLRDNVSGLSICLASKSHPLISPIPVLVLSQSKDKAIIQAFYGAGADTVMLAPFEADLIFFQISALARQKKAFEEQLQSFRDNRGLEQSTMGALDCVREPLVVFNNEKIPVFMNQSALSLFGIQDETKGLIGYEEILNPLSGFLTEEVMSEQPCSKEYSLSRVGGQVFPARLKVNILWGHSREIAGYALCIRDTHELTHMSYLLSQGQHTRSLALLTASGTLKLLRSIYSQIPISPFERFQQLLTEEPLNSDLSATVLALLETLDLALNPGVEIKVQLKREWKLAIRFSDLFQILGHLLMYAVEHAGVGGETTIKSQETLVEGDITVTISATAQRMPSFLPSDEWSEVLQGKPLSLPEDKEKAHSSLDIAQSIADRYGKEIELKSSPTQTKIRIKLPIIQG